jgi:hypothetical protein
MSSAAPGNLLLQDIEYQVTETTSGTWRRFMYPSGKVFTEYKSRRTWGELPLVHYTFGRSPETGKFATAHGVLAIGPFARGYVAIGFLARGLLAAGLLTLGFIAVGLVGVGLLLGVGQLAVGLFSVGQFSIAVIFALGQFAAGHVAIGQIAVGSYVLAQLGWGDHVWDTRAVDPAAHHFFLSLIGK